MIAALVLATCAQQGVTFESLLHDLVDREHLARLPDPPYVSFEASHLVREPASGDLLVERVEGRETFLVLDVEGPGALVRIASPNPSGRLRVWIDGSDTPVLDGDAAALLGHWPAFPAPLAQDLGGILACFVPVPFARRCKISCTAPREYMVDYRKYAERTSCASVTRAQMALVSDAPDVTAEAWSRPPAPLGEHAFDFTLSEDVPEGSFVAANASAAVGARAISEIVLTLEGGGAAELLRRAILRMRFDGEETVVCPLVDLFALADGPSVIRTAPITVTSETKLVSRWIMPYRERCELSIENRGPRGAHFSGAVRTIPWSWDERSMHFHAAWRADEERADGAPKIVIQGRGVLVGDAVARFDIGPDPRAGLELVVDGVRMSGGGGDRLGSVQRGTEHPLHALTTTANADRSTWRTSVRFRALDALPFSSRIDLETPIRYVGARRATTVFFYALPGAKTDVPPITDAMLSLRAPPPPEQAPK